MGNLRIIGWPTAVALFVGFIVFGCGHGTQPPAKPSRQEIQTDSDRFFEKMGEEERRIDQGAP